MRWRSWRRRGGDEKDKEKDSRKRKDDRGE
jgi:hypothetical protein